jgi:hypothetical protein
MSQGHPQLYDRRPNDISLDEVERIGCKRCPRQPDLSSLTGLLPIKKAATEVTAKFREETSKKAALGCQVQIALHNGMRKGAHPKLCASAPSREHVW